MKTVEARIANHLGIFLAVLAAAVLVLENWA